MKRGMIQSTEIDEDGAWIYLNSGYQIDGVHAIVEDTMEQARAKLEFVRPCNCSPCLSDLKGERK